MPTLNDWLREYDSRDVPSVGTLVLFPADSAGWNKVIIERPYYKSETATLHRILEKNLVECCVYFAICNAALDECVTPPAFFSYPDRAWEADKEFQNDCIVFTIFHKNNRISAKTFYKNYWLPFETVTFNGHEYPQTENTIYNFLMKRGLEKGYDQGFSKLALDYLFNVKHNIYPLFYGALHDMEHLFVDASIRDVLEYFTQPRDEWLPPLSVLDGHLPAAVSQLDTVRLACKIIPKIYAYGFAQGNYVLKHPQWQVQTDEERAAEFNAKLKAFEKMKKIEEAEKQRLENEKRKAENEIVDNASANRDEEVCKVLQEKPRLLLEIPKPLRKQVYIKTALAIEPSLFSRLDNDEVNAEALEIVFAKDNTAIPDAIDHLKTDLDRINLLHRHGWLIKYVPNPTKDMQKAAIEQNPYSILSIKNPDTRLVVEAIKKKPILIWDIKNPTEKMLEAAAGVPGLYNQKNKMPQYYSAVLAYVKKNGYALRKIRRKFKTYELCKAAVENAPGAIKYVPLHILKKHPDIGSR
jgi:hypothetical protein